MYKKIFSSVCVLSMVFTLSFGFFLTTPQKANAQFVPVGDIVNLPFHEGNFFKENALDGILFSIVKLAAQQLVVNMTDWVASGFDGSPAFVTNEFASITQLQDEAILDLLTNETAQIYADAPFRDTLLSLVAEDYVSTYSSSGYNLDEAVEGDVDAFLEGDFLQGGWEGWYALTQNPDNNFFGSYLKTQNEVANRVAVAQEAIEAELDRGAGFFSLRDESGNIITPGSIIEQQLGFNLGSGMRQLEAADEYSEIISASITALTEALIQQGITTATDTANDAIADAEGSVRDALANQDDLLNLINGVRGEADSSRDAAANGGTTGNTDSTNPDSDTYCYEVVETVETIIPATETEPERVEVTQTTTNECVTGRSACVEERNSLASVVRDTIEVSACTLQ